MAAGGLTISRTSRHGVGDAARKRGGLPSAGKSRRAHSAAFRRRPP